MLLGHLILTRSGDSDGDKGPQASTFSPRRCHKIGHCLAKDCWARQRAGNSSQTELRGKMASASATKQVKSSQKLESELPNPGMLEMLFSSEEEESASNARLVRVRDRGSHPQCVRVKIHCVPVEGIIDSGADITIIGGGLFRKVAAVARLKKRDLQNPSQL